MLSTGWFQEQIQAWSNNENLSSESDGVLNAIEQKAANGTRMHTLLKVLLNQIITNKPTLL